MQGTGSVAPWPAPGFMRLTPDSRAPAYVGMCIGRLCLRLGVCRYLSRFLSLPQGRGRASLPHYGDRDFGRPGSILLEKGPGRLGVYLVYAEVGRAVLRASLSLSL